MFGQLDDIGDMSEGFSEPDDAPDTAPHVSSSKQQGPLDFGSRRCLESKLDELLMRRQIQEYDFGTDFNFDLD